MFDNLDLSKMGEMLNSVQEKVKAYEDEVANKIFETKAGGGLISVQINGNGEILDINIDDELLEDKQSLQILLISAVNDAIALASEEKKKGAAQAFGLGGLGGFGL